MNSLTFDQPQKFIDKGLSDVDEGIALIDFTQAYRTTIFLLIYLSLLDAVTKYIPGASGRSRLME